MASKKIKDLSKKAMSSRKADAVKGGAKKKAPSLLRRRAG